MKNYYVTVDPDDYIDNWSVIEAEGYTAIKADETLFGRLECVKIVGNVAVLDEEKLKQLAEVKPEPTEIEIIQAENQQLKERLDLSEAVALEAKERLDLSEAVALEAMDGLFRLKEEIETLKGGESNG